MTTVDTSYFDTWANYSVGYDITETNKTNGYYKLKVYGVLNVTGNNISWDWGNATVQDKTVGISSSYGNGSYTLVSKEIQVNVDANGYSSVYIGGNISTSYKSGSCGKTVSLPKMDRGFTQTPSISFSSKTAHSLTFSWTTSQNCSKIIAVVNGSSSQIWTGNASSGTFTINNLSSDTQYEVYGKFTRKDTGVSNDSNKVTEKTKKMPVRIRVNGAWEEAMPYVRVNGVWKEAKPYIRVNNEWKEGI